jgi:hypothetical protein
VVLLGHRRNRRSGARLQESLGHCGRGKARTVNCCEQANALIHRIAGGWSETRREVDLDSSCEVPVTSKEAVPSEVHHFLRDRRFTGVILKLPTWTSGWRQLAQICRSSLYMQAAGTASAADTNSPYKSSLNSDLPASVEWKPNKANTATMQSMRMEAPVAGAERSAVSGSAMSTLKV